MSSAEVAVAPPTPAVAPIPVYTRPVTTSISTIRRKPKITYQSPSAHYNPPSLRIEASAHAFLRAVAAKVGESSSPPADCTPANVKPKRKVKKVKDGQVEKKPFIRPTMRYSMGPPLPLYHPLGRLALSLPELDPATLGLPPLPTDDGSRRSSARTRRPAAKLREADEDAAMSTPAVSAAASNEVKEKASPKKKGGARPGAGMKRKRKDADEDATYPAKKTRAPRGGGSALARVTTSETPSPPEAVTPATPDSTVEAPEEKRPERRSTRSRGTLLRRDSSGSEVTATSVSVSVANTSARKAKSVELKTPTTEDGKGVNKGEGVVAEDATH